MCLCIKHLELPDVCYEECVDIASQLREVLNKLDGHPLPNIGQHALINTKL